MNLRNSMVLGSAKGLGPWQKKILKKLHWYEAIWGPAQTNTVHRWRYPEGGRSMSYVGPLLRGLERRGLIHRTAGNGWATSVDRDFWRTI